MSIALLAFEWKKRPARMNQAALWVARWLGKPRSPSMVQEYALGGGKSIVMPAKPPHAVFALQLF